MTPSTPPAWHWLHECYVPVQTPEPPIRSQEPPDSATSGKQNDREALSVDSCIRSDSATFGVQNDNPDPTYQDCWPSERYPSDGPERAVSTTASSAVCADQCDECAGVQIVRETPTKLRVGARNEHPAWVCNDCGQDRYGKPNGVSTWHLDRCGICGEWEEVTEARDFGAYGLDDGLKPGATPNPFPEVLYSMMAEAHNRHDDDPTCTVAAPETTSPADSCVESCGSCADTACADILPEGEMRNAAPPCAYYQESPTFTQGENSADVKVTSCPECGSVTDIEYGDEGHDETYFVPFKTQEWIFESLIELEIDHLHEIIDDHHDEIVALARERHREGHVLHGSKGYQWDAKTRLRNVLEELSDAPTYLTMGPIE